MNEDESKPPEKSNLMGQWIISLAISIVCCAVIFVIFAAYIMNLHSELSVNTVRIEMVREQQKQMAAELYLLRRPIQIQVSNQNQPAPPPGGAPAGAPPSPAAAAGGGTAVSPETVVPGVLSRIVPNLPGSPGGIGVEKDQGTGEPVKP